MTCLPPSRLYGSTAGKGDDMTDNDYRQIYKVIERCGVELSGVAVRLREHGDSEAAGIAEATIANLVTRLETLQSCRAACVRPLAPSRLAIRRRSMRSMMK